MKKIKGYVVRKSMLYVTGVEYGDYTMNHVLGCAHGCKYPCYAYILKKRFGQIKSYEQWTEPFLVSNTLELLDSEIPKLKDKIKSVQLCFTTDPFMYGYDEVKEMSIQAIKKLNDSDIKCVVLTKGELPYELAALSKKNEYGITLISTDESYRQRMEPQAAPYKDRIEALRALHDAGYYTWVSMEPYPTPNLIEQDFEKLLMEVAFVNKIIFGRTNYSKEVSSYKLHRDFYNKKVELLVDFCKKNNIDYHIKRGTITNS